MAYWLSNGMPGWMHMLSSEHKTVEIVATGKKKQ
jgi:hypothetical protein